MPYYLLFYPDNQELSLFRHDGTRYVTVLPDEAGRCTVPELEMAVSLTDGWARYWHQGEMLPLPGELLRRLDRADLEAARQRERADAAERARQESESARLALADQLARLQAELRALKSAGGAAS